VQGWVLPYLIEWVETQGFNAASIRKLRGMAELTDPDLRVPEASVEAAWQLATTLTSDDAVVIALPQMDEPQVDGKNLILSWLDPFMLQTSTNDATGPYHDLVGATSPFSKPNDCSAAGLGTICGTISR